MIIYGKNSLKEALDSKVTINKVLIQKDLFGKDSQELINAIKQLGIEYQFVSRVVLDKKSSFNKHQGFVAEISEFTYSSIDDIIGFAKSKGEQLFICLLNGIEDPHNLGSIIRSCECAGCHGIVIEKHGACDVNSTVVKVSAGASSHIKIAKVTNLNQTIEFLKKNGVWVFALEADGDDIYSTNLKGDLALVVGSEGNGVSRLVRKNCDGVISLPLKGKVNSLNASNACAIALFEAVRQRRN